MEMETSHECYLCGFASNEEDYYIYTSIDIPGNYETICLSCDDKRSEYLNDSYESLVREGS